jgi:hypothetical protein
VGDGLDGARHLLVVGVFQDVAAGAGAQGGEDRVVVLEHRHHQNVDLRGGDGEPADRGQAVAPGHVQVEQDHPGMQFVGQTYGLGAVDCLADHFDAGQGAQQRT